MSETTPGFKPKKSVALSGVVAGNTALCTVGRTGNDLHYRGYDILDIAATCEFEEVAYLLIHGKLPNHSELAAYKAKLVRLRPLPAAVRGVLEELPAASHPMDVMRSGVSALGCVLPEKDDHSQAGARDIADRLIASLGWSIGITTATPASASRSTARTIRSAVTSCTCCTGTGRRASGCMQCTPR